LPSMHFLFPFVKSVGVARNSRGHGVRGAQKDAEHVTGCGVGSSPAATRPTNTARTAHFVADANVLPTPPMPRLFIF
jgi:hypothetical protein